MQYELDFGREWRLFKAKRDLVCHPEFAYLTEAGTIYVCAPRSIKDEYRIEARVFQGPEVEWFHLMKVDFDSAAYFVYKDLATLHWSLRDNPEELKRFNEWRL